MDNFSSLHLARSSRNVTKNNHTKPPAVPRSETETYFCQERKSWWKKQYLNLTITCFVAQLKLLSHAAAQLLKNTIQDVI